MKRLLAWILMTVMLSSWVPSFVFAEEYTIPNATGNHNKNYVTREEAISAFVRAMNTDTAQTSTHVLTQFTDAGKIASAYTREIAAAVSKGLVSGYEDGTFRPQKQITRIEALVILNRILSGRSLPQTIDLQFFDTPLWAEKEINRLARAGVVKGYGNGYLGSSDLLTREQVLLLAERAARMVGPAGNYYEYANEDWLSQNEIPEGLSVWTGNSAMQQDLMKEIGNVVYTLYRQKNRDAAAFPQGSSEQKIVDVFSSGANAVYRDSLGLEPAKPYLAKIDSIQNMNDLLLVMAELERCGFHGLLPIAISTDAKNSTCYQLTYSECYTGINVDLAKNEPVKTKKAYCGYIASLFDLFKLGNAKNRAEKVAELCFDLSSSSLSLEDLGKIEQRYQVYSLDELAGIFSNLDIKSFLQTLGFTNIDGLVVYDLNLAKAVNEIYTQENLSLLKDYLRASVMDASSTCLNTDAFLIWRDFQDALNGTESQVLPADYAIQNVEELLGWDLAKLYVQKYPNKKAITAVKSITEEILDTYQKRIQKNAWLSKEGKASALKKLKNLKVLIGYPEDIDQYPDTGYHIKSMKDGGNLLAYRVAYCNRYFETGSSLLENKDETHNKETWHMLPFTINAMYDVSSNSITIPTGILREPFYTFNASREWNLGSIGSVIAHEISHALDAIGSQFDENGNLNNWWLAEDKKAFDSICKHVEAAYGGIAFLPNSYINGKATLSENMADLAGMACILDIAGKGNPRLEDVFKGYASIWQILATEEYHKTMLKTDTHAPDSVRVNRVLSNFDVFLDFYQVLPEDGMYLPEKERIQIWNR